MAVAAVSFFRPSDEAYFENFNSREGNETEADRDLLAEAG